MQVARWGNSLAVRIPVELAAKLGLSQGQEIAMRAKVRDAGVSDTSGGLAEAQATYLAEAQKSVVGQWGNSLGIRLSKALTEQLGIKEEDNVTLVQTEAGSIEVERTRTRAEALASFCQSRGIFTGSTQFPREDLLLRGRDVQD
jgi:antitoxin component of MazEF toxin-antitoxin module